MPEGKQIPPFYLIDKVVKDYLRCEGWGGGDDKALFTIGENYYNFDKGKEPRICLQVPSYSRETLTTVVDYLVKIDFLLKLLQQGVIDNFEGKSLFNIFAFDPAHLSKTKKRLLNFQKANSNQVFFEGATVRARDRFLPVFVTEQLSDRVTNEITYKSFNFFDAIVNNGMLRHATEIDLKNSITLILEGGKALPKTTLKTLILSQHSVSSDLQTSIKELKSLNISNVITVRYPYSQRVDSRIYRVLGHQVKRFDLCLRERMFFGDLQSHDLILTQAELNREESFDAKTLLASFQIIDTDHPARIDEIFAELRSLWVTEGFNPYKTPFPTKWLMCINTRRKLEWWVAQYKIDFPSVKGSILSLVTELIGLLYEQNWWSGQENELRGSNVVIPNSNTFPVVVNVLFQYLSDYATSVQFSDDSKIYKFPESLRCYDALNLNFILNCDSQIRKAKIQFFIPDFFLLRVRPFFLVKIWDKMIEARFGGARVFQVTSPSGPDQAERTILLQHIAIQLRRYNKRFANNVVEDDVDQLLSESDAELTDSEVSEIVAERYEAVGDDRDLVITANDNTEFKLKSGSRVLVDEMGRMVTTVAGVMSEGSRFFPVSLLSQHINAAHLANKMSTVPASAIGWTKELHDQQQLVPSLFQHLKARGLSILETTFNHSYTTVKAEEFFLPRRYSDWQLICDFLQIKQVAEAWNSYKCRKDLNQLRKVYVEVIEILFDRGILGVNVDDETIEKISMVMDQINEGHENLNDRHKYARQLVMEITSKIELKTVKAIVKITQSHEHI